MRPAAASNTKKGEHSTAGRWSISEGTLCTIYDNDPTGGCFRVLKTGSNCFEFYFVARNEYEAAHIQGALYFDIDEIAASARNAVRRAR